MKKFSKPTMAVLAVFIMAFAALWLFSPQWMQTSEGMVAIAGNTPPSLNQANQTGHSDPNQQLELIIGLKLRNVQALDVLIDSQKDPASPQFRKFISPDQFVRDYAPASLDVARVVTSLQTHGLTVVEIAANRQYIRVRGTVSQIETAFNVHINTYRVGARDVYSNDRNPSVPADLKDVVQGVIGLDSLSVYHSRMVHGHAAAAPPPAAPGPAPAPPAGHAPAPPPPNVPVGYGPGDLATAYDYPTASNARAGAIHDGQGVTLAIVSVFSYLRSDVQAYWHYYGIKRTGTVTNVFPAGANNQPDPETTLDLEQLGALSPGADIDMYLGHDPDFGSFVSGYNRVVIDNKASVATSSWGLCEADTDPAEINTEDNIFKEGQAQGITFLAAAGDDGAYDCPSKTPVLGVDFPASDSYFIAVGGTTLFVDPVDGSRLVEAAWAGAGGGISDFFSQPAWQFGPGVPKNGKRNSSDISVNADPDTGDSFYFLGVWGGAGGTSFASPDLAALFGEAVQANGGRLGYVAPALYRILRSPQYAHVFYDITIGRNDAYRGKKYPGYPAGAGWDAPTGVGSPDGRALIEWLIDEQRHSANPKGTPLPDAVPLTIPVAAPAAPGR